jgi:hypothetical protein
MKRTICCLGLVVLSLLSFFAGQSHRTDAKQDADSTIPVHPIVGSWVVRDSSRIWPTELFTVTFTSDGTVILVDANGEVGNGVWSPTPYELSDTVVQFGIVFLGSDGTGAAGFKQVGYADVTEDGNSLVEDTSLPGGGDFRGARITAGPSFTEVPPESTPST